ncbi:hypothetical protein SAMN02910298_02944 [Pseudobutyrivibrio sp. YE44]|uniref:hypothetical protein n=1 Tax=Pseudobutyrivibrio sp. YE44 TaxID=1520802 RepID=UPI000886D711|nr:hypothetical protein [Pseudobutyrivibrio sp. YE44]SDB57069.1 hypothetical protein SAMN02910298_02944 [Pseudobutyrivibrio sp. YE44]
MKKRLTNMNIGENFTNNASFLDNKIFTKTVNSIGDTALNLVMDYDLFQRDVEVAGTDSMFRMTSVINGLHDVSNSLKPHVIGDIVPAFEQVQKELNFDDLMSSEGIEATFL